MTELERTLLSALEKFEQRQTEQQRALDSVSNALERVSSEYELLSRQVHALETQLAELSR